MSSQNSSNVSPNEEITLILLAAAAIPVVLSVATWHKLVVWLVDHAVLVPAAQDPLLKLPAADGVGLDFPRLAVAAAVLVFAVVFGIAALRRRAPEEDLR